MEGVVGNIICSHDDQFTLTLKIATTSRAVGYWPYFRAVLKNSIAWKWHCSTLPCSSSDRFWTPKTTSAMGIPVIFMIWNATKYIENNRIRACQLKSGVCYGTSPQIGGTRSSYFDALSRQDGTKVSLDAGSKKTRRAWRSSTDVVENMMSTAHAWRLV